MGIEIVPFSSDPIFLYDMYDYVYVYIYTTAHTTGLNLLSKIRLFLIYFKVRSRARTGRGNNRMCPGPLEG